MVYADQALAYTEAPEHARALLKQRFRWTYGVLQACWKHKARLFHRGGNECNGGQGRPEPVQPVRGYADDVHGRLG